MNIVTTKDNFKNSEDATLGKVVRNYYVAKRILRLGGESVRIIDIKIDRYNSNRCVFVFRNDEVFQKYFTQVIDELRESRNNINQEKIKNYEAEIKDLKRQLAERE